MNDVQAISGLSQLPEVLFAESFKTQPTSTLWIGNNNEEMPITSITIDETSSDLVIRISLRDIDPSSISLQVTQETLLITGNWDKSLEVEGYFRPPQFQSLVPLPFAVQPKSGFARFDHDTLVIRLAIQLAIPAVKTHLRIAHTPLSFSVLNA